MGNIAFDFLADSLFSHSYNIENNFKDESDARIEKELEDYRKHCIDNYSNLTEEITSSGSFLKVFSTIEETSIDLLKQTALYVEQFIIADPLFPLSDFQSEASKTTSQFLGYRSGNSINRQRLTKAASFLKDVTPMVAGNYLKLLPLSYHFEAKKNIPINFPDDYYNKILPKETLEFFWKNVIVKSLKKNSSGDWQVMDDKLFPSRGIIIDFKDSNHSHTSVYHLFDSEFTQSDESSDELNFIITLPDTPPDNDEFLAWVQQSVNLSSKTYYDRIVQEILIATNLNSTYLCDNTFSSDVISRDIQANETIQTYTANQFINADLPFLDKIDIQKLMDIRAGEADTFTNFRLEIEKHFRELRTITDPAQINLKIDNIFHELNEVQVQKIQQKFQHLKKQTLRNSVIAVGGLVGMIAATGSLFATMAAVLGVGGKVYKDYKDYEEKLTENPAYLLWKIRK